MGHTKYLNMYVWVSHNKQMPLGQTTKEYTHPTLLSSDYLPLCSSSDYILKLYRFIYYGELALTRNMDRPTDRVIPIYPPKRCL